MSNAFFRGGPGIFQSVVALGADAVETQTRLLCAVPFRARVTGVDFVGADKATGDALSAQVFVGEVAVCADTDVSDAAGGVAATLAGGGTLEPGDVLTVEITADNISAGPGDLLVAVSYEPIV